MHIGGMTRASEVKWPQDLKPNESSMMILHHCTKLKLWAQLCSEETGLLTMLLWSTLKEGHINCFAHPNCCQLVVFRCGWGTKGKSIPFLFFIFWAIIFICCGYLVQHEESSRRTFLDWGNKTPWRNCWGTMDSMDWLLLSKRVNGDCVFVHVCHQNSLVVKINKLNFLLISSNLPHSHVDLYIHGLEFSWGLGLAQNTITSILRKEH